MSHNNHNNSSCSRAEQMISYLYDEADARAKLAFEAHLKTCPSCADELASFGFVRSSILDWRAADFANLKTPAFEVPALESKKSFSTVAASNDPRPWFADFKSLFSFNRRLATAALTILIVCVGAALLAFNFASKTDVAKSEANKNSTEAAVSPSIEAVRKPEEASVADNNSKKPLPIVDSSNNVSQPSPRERAADKAAVKVSANAPKNNIAGSTRELKNTNDNIKKTTPTRKQQVPNLNDIEDDEDETIRLADLFEEIDTK